MTSDTRPSTLARLDPNVLREAMENVGAPWMPPAFIEELATEYSRLLEERPKVAPESESEKREAFGK